MQGRPAFSELARGSASYYVRPARGVTCLPRPAASCAQRPARPRGRWIARRLFTVTASVTASLGGTKSRDFLSRSLPRALNGPRVDRRNCACVPGPDVKPASLVSELGGGRDRPLQLDFTLRVGPGHSIRCFRAKQVLECWAAGPGGWARPWAQEVGGLVAQGQRSLAGSAWAHARRAVIGLGPLGRTLL